MNTAAARASMLLNPHWWFLASALLLGAALVPTYLGSRRIKQWVNAMESTHCHTPWPHRPDLVASGWAAVYLVTPAAVCLVVALTLFLRGRHRLWVKTIVTLAGVCVLLAALLVWVIGYTDATQGIDLATVSDSHGGPLCHVSG